MTSSSQHVPPHTLSGHRRRQLRLAQYIRRRNGVPAGAPGGLRNMLSRAFGARSFDVFWQHWNPIFGYFLGRYIYSPLRRWLPAAIAWIVTFLACGALHDVVATAVRGSWVFLFTPWFILLGIGSLISQVVRMDMSRLLWPIRATAHLLYLGGTLALASALVRASS